MFIATCWGCLAALSDTGQWELGTAYCGFLSCKQSLNVVTDGADSKHGHADVLGNGCTCTCWSLVILVIPIRLVVWYRHVPPTSSMWHNRNVGRQSFGRVPRDCWTRYPFSNLIAGAFVYSSLATLQILTLPCRMVLVVIRNLVQPRTMISEVGLLNT